MTSLTVSLVMQTALLAAGPSDDASYAKAHETTTKTGKPMLVLVGAKWCPACVQMKQSVVPKLKERGALAQVAFAEVDIDHQRNLGRQLTKGGPIPQLLMYRHTKLGWRLRRIVGGQTVERVEDFISEGIKLDKASKIRKASTPVRGKKSDASSSEQPDRST